MKVPCRPSLSASSAFSAAIFFSLIRTYPLLGSTATQPASAPESNSAAALDAKLTSAAEDAAYAALTDKILTITLAGGGTVASALSRAPAAEIALRQAILAAPAQKDVLNIGTGHVDVRLSIPADRIAGILAGPLELSQADPEGHQRVPLVTGALQKSGSAVRGLVSADAPPGWRHCTSNQIEQARTAARIDAAHRFKQAISLVSLRGRSLRDLFAENPKLADAIEAKAGDRNEIRIALDPTCVARAELRLSREAIVGLLKTAAIDAGAAWNSVAEVAQAVPEAGLNIEGYGVPPPRDTGFQRAEQKLKAQATPPIPREWAASTLIARATGRVPPNAADEKSRKDLAMTAARIEASRRLWLEVENLPMPDGAHVRDRLAGRPDLIAAIEAAITPVASPEYDSSTGIAQVRIGISPMTLWQLVGGSETLDP